MISSIRFWMWCFALLPLGAMAQTGGAFTSTPPSNHGCRVGTRLYYQFQNNFTSGINFRRKYDPNFFYELICTNGNYYVLGTFVNQNNLAGGPTATNGCGIVGTDYSSTTGGQMFMYSVISCDLDKYTFLILCIFSCGFLASNYGSKTKEMTEIF